MTSLVPDQAIHKPLRIGLTGGIASGKSSAATAFKELGIDVISADEIAKEILQKGSPALKQVVQNFGQTILNAHSELDRRKLRELIFDDSEKRKTLNAITHPAIRKQMDRLAQNSLTPYVVLEIPLLIESKLHNLVNRVMLVTTDEDIQLNRIIQRDNCSIEHAKSILKAQTTNQIRRLHADDCIRNSGSFNKLNNQVLLLHQKYLSLVHSTQNNKTQAQLNQKIGLDLH